MLPTKKKVSYQSQCERAAVNNCIFCSMKSDAVADLIYIYNIYVDKVR